MRNTARAIALIFVVLLVVTILGCYGGGGGGGGWGTPTATPTAPITWTPTYSPTWTPTWSPTSSPYPTITPTSTVYGTLEGTITQAERSDKSTPVPSALVSIIDDGLSAYTDTSGKFTIQNISPGQKMVRVQGNGQTLTNYVTIVGGKTTVITVELPSGGSSTPTPTPTSTSTQTGKLNVSAYSFYESGEQVGVKYIRVWEYGNYNKRWYNSWTESTIQTSYQLGCSNATIGKYYVVEVGWQNGDTRTSDSNYFYYDGQTIWINHY
ncbi:MAG: hypothetical protein LWY06_16405 [Firmicutes bacterium]|nr:hypothetical protein [Bacillota bacterium]